MKILFFLFFLLVLTLNASAQNQQPLTEANFEKKRLEIAGQSFDSERIKQAKSFSDAQYLHTHQIDAIMQSMRFESNRLDYAKYAYTTVIDAHNYPQLLHHFNMKSYQSAFHSFLSNRQVANKPSTESKEEGTLNNTAIESTPKNTPQKMQDQAFNAARQAIEDESYESRRLKRMKQLSDANYMLCGQLSELMQLLSFESSKLEFAIYAFPKSFDPSNYQVLKDQLKRKGSQTALQDFIAKQDITDYSIDTLVQTPSKKPIDEPMVKAVSEEDFNQIYYLVQQQNSDAKKLEKAKLLTDRTLVSTEQVGQLVQLFVFENSRTDYVEYAFYRTTNPAEFGQLKAFLETESQVLIDQLLLQTGGDSIGNTPHSLALSDEDFEALVKKINGLVLESHKLERAQTTVDRSPLMASQIAQINELFSLEETKLSFAQYAYIHVVDPQNYSVVRNSLYKNNSRFALDRYIKDQK